MYCVCCTETVLVEIETQLSTGVPLPATLLGVTSSGREVPWEILFWIANRPAIQQEVHYLGVPFLQQWFWQMALWLRERAQHSLESIRLGLACLGYCCLESIHWQCCKAYHDFQQSDQAVSSSGLKNLNRI